MITRSLIASAAAAFVAGALLSSGAVAAPTSDVTKVTAGKADQTTIQMAQMEEKKKKKGKGKKKKS